MRYLSAIVSFCIILSIGDVSSQEHENSVSLFGSFTTSSKLFHHPNDADEFYRSQYLPLDDIFGFGIDYRRNFSSWRLQAGLTIEFLFKTEQYFLPSTDKKQIRASDGFITIPIELSIYFIIPVGGPTIRPFIGGGVGLYWGQRLYEYANVRARTINQEIGGGIHVVSGAEYTLTSLISLRAEIKFRDVQFKATNKFSQEAAVYNGSIITIPQEPFASRVHIDGMMFTLGTIFHF